MTIIMFKINKAIMIQVDSYTRNKKVNNKMKQIFKKMLIVISASGLLFAAINYKLNHDYHLAKNLNLSAQTQNSFWNDLNKTRAIKAGANGFDNDGPKTFSIDLNEEYKVFYSNISNYKSSFEVSIISKDFSQPSSMRFVVSTKNLVVIHEDDMDDEPIINENEKQELKNLAIQKFKDFQEEYYKVNK